MTITFSTYLTVTPGQDTFQRALALKKAFLDQMAAVAASPAYFSSEEYTVLTRQIADDRIWERETADGFIGTLAFWWASAGTPYYLGYNDALQRVTPGGHFALHRGMGHQPAQRALSPHEPQGLRARERVGDGRRVDADHP